MNYPNYLTADHAASFFNAEQGQKHFEQAYGIMHQIKNSLN